MQVQYEVKKGNPKMPPTWGELFKNGESERLGRLGKICFLYNIPKYYSFFHKYFRGERKLTVLELGAGGGEMSKYIIENSKNFINSYLTGEITDEGVERLNELGIRAEKMNAEDISYPDNSFDAVCCFDVMHHVRNCRKMGSEMTRVAKKFVFLIEANGLSIGRKVLELTPWYRSLGEKSYCPREYFSFFPEEKFQLLSIKPFLIVFPGLPSVLYKPMIACSETLERLPFLRWQCTSVLIFGKKKPG